MLPVDVAFKNTQASQLTVPEPWALMVIEQTVSILEPQL